MSFRGVTVPVPKEAVRKFGKGTTGGGATNVPRRPKAKNKDPNFG